jgi:hypothetical protein
MATALNHFTVTETTTGPSTQKRNRTSSLNSLPLIEEKVTDEDKQDTVSPTNPSTDEAEVSMPTPSEAAARRSRAKAYVIQRLQTLQFDAWHEINNGLECIVLRSPYVREVTGIGTVNPEVWMQVCKCELWVLDRRCLGEINPHAFTKSGVLREKLNVVDRPEAIPALYWEWLRGKAVDAGQWAVGWVRTEPSLEWIARWRDGELSKREWFGQGNVGFTNENQVEEFERDENVQ